MAEIKDLHVADPAFQDDIERVVNDLKVMGVDADGNFRPKEPVKREELAAVINRLSGGAA